MTQDLFLNSHREIVSKQAWDLEHLLYASENNWTEREHLVLGRLKGSFSEFGVYFTYAVNVAQSRFGSVFLLLLVRQSFKTFNSHACCCDCCQVFGFLSTKQSIKSSFLASQGSVSFILHLMSFLLVNTISGTRVNVWEWMCVWRFLQWIIQSILNILGVSSVTWHAATKREVSNSKMLH